MDLSKQRAGFREYIPPRDTQRSKDLSESNTYKWTKLRCAETFVAEWIKSWEELYNEPYKGITVDGKVITDLYHVAKEDEDLGAPTPEIVKAAQNVLEIASPEEKRAISRQVDSPEWRRWINPELYIYRSGVRLEEVSEDLITALHGLMRASLSPAGYKKATGCMKVNRFLGEIVDGRGVLNERSYNFVIFGIPSMKEPWGWQVYGHHFCMSCFVIGKQMVISPVFMGAEPNIIDTGPDKGIELFTDQEQIALQLMRSMNSVTLEDVQIYHRLSGPDFPSWRYHRADQRHLGGAFQDNRIIPYEGSKVSILSEFQQGLVRELIILSLNYLPEKALAAKMEEIRVHWTETYFCWIGGFQKTDAFYYKVHSPVVMIEFDHHSGVFLNNKDPLPFHIHTLVRTPNGNDYGKELLKQYQQRERSK